MVSLSSTGGGEYTACTVLRYVVSLGPCIRLREGDGVTRIAVGARFAIFLLWQLCPVDMDPVKMNTPLNGHHFGGQAGKIHAFLFRYYEQLILWTIFGEQRRCPYQPRHHCT